MLKHPPNAAAALHAAINERMLKGHLSRFRAEQRLEAGNALAVLRSVRKRGEDVRLHMSQGVEQWKTLQPKRAATYARWLRRMEKQQ